jgi:hypothetical protein
LALRQSWNVAASWSGRKPKLTPHQRCEAQKRLEERRDATQRGPQLQRQSGDDFEVVIAATNWRNEDRGGSSMSLSLDDIIKQRARIYADRLTLAASKAKKEEEIRIASEHELAFLQDAAGIKLEGKT